jgi:hypothetical protein
MEAIKKEYKLVFNAGVSRRLLKMGIPIADIKSDRTNSDKTVFVFKRTPEFENAFAQINKEIAEAKAAEEVI